MLCSEDHNCHNLSLINLIMVRCTCDLITLQKRNKVVVLYYWWLLQLHHVGMEETVPLHTTWRKEHMHPTLTKHVVLQ